MVQRSQGIWTHSAFFWRRCLCALLFDPEKGYRTLDEAETVEFEREQGPKGLNAVNVMRNA